MKVVTAPEYYALKKEDVAVFLGGGITNCDDCISRVLKRMWNCRGKWTLSIDKIAMEKIIREELSSAQTTTRHSVEFKEEGCEDRAEIYPICPNCKEPLDNEKWGFCPYCGILIEWER